MASEQKASEKGLAKAEAGVWVESDTVADVVAGPWLNRKRNHSLIPPKRKSVKRMMFDAILGFIASIFESPGNPTSSGASINQGAGVGRANVRKILPDP